MTDNVRKGAFGSCCKDLSDAMTQPPNSFLFEEDNGVLYSTVGYVNTEQGTAWFDQAIIYCRFCGKQLQFKEDIARRSKQ